MRGGVRAWVWGIGLFVVGCSAALDYPVPEERCDNGIDDDLDGRIDCADPSCDGACPERSTVACRNGRDDDGDGLVDLQEPACWVLGRWSTERCLSTAGRAFRLTASDAGILARGSFTLVPDPRADPVSGCEGADALDCALRLDPPTRSPITATVPFLVASVPFEGGDCVRVGAEVELDPGPVAEGAASAEVSIALAPPTAIPKTDIFGPNDPPLPARDSVVLGARLRRTAESATLTLTLSVGGFAPETFASETLEVRPGPFVVTLEAINGVWQGVARSATGAPPDVTVDHPDALWPAQWTSDVPLRVVAYAGRTLATEPQVPVLLRSLNAVRESGDPCGYRAPQLPTTPAGSDGITPGRVLAAAGDGDRLCALGWREPALDLPPDATLPISSWFVDQPLELETISGPRGAPLEVARALLSERWTLGQDEELPIVSSSAAAMIALPDGGIEAVVVARLGPDDPAALRRLRSDDCRRWLADDEALRIPSVVPEGLVPVGLRRHPETGERVLHLADPDRAGGAAVVTLRARPETPTVYDRVTEWSAGFDEPVPGNQPARIAQVLDGPSPDVLLVEDDGSVFVVVGGDASADEETGEPVLLFEPSGVPTSADRFGSELSQLLTFGEDPGTLPVVFGFRRGVPRLDVEVALTLRVAVDLVTLEAVP